MSWTLKRLRQVLPQHLPGNVKQYMTRSIPMDSLFHFVKTLHCQDSFWIKNQYTCRTAFKESLFSELLTVYWNFFYLTRQEIPLWFQGGPETSWTLQNWCLLSAVLNEQLLKERSEEGCTVPGCAVCSSLKLYWLWDINNGKMVAGTKTSKMRKSLFKSS